MIASLVMVRILDRYDCVCPGKYRRTCHDTSRLAWF
jgi:hypothetical protein